MLETSKGLTLGSEWLSSKLPFLSFNRVQGKNIRKDSKAQNLDITANVKVILDDKNYSVEFNFVFDRYDFNTFANLNGNTFLNLIPEWLQENSMIINIIISA